VSDQDPQQNPVAGASAPPAAGAESPARRDRADLKEGLAWCAFGLAVLIGSLTMDRLEEQGVAIYAAPGLLPGLLGIVMILFGAAVAMRRKPILVTKEEMEQRRYRLQPGRLALVTGLCLIYSVVLIGRGLPFWLASALFVSVSILVLQHPQRKAAGRRLDARAVGFAVVVGLGAGILATLVFEKFFLVHLP
jgi:hypothetical protein